MVDGVRLVGRENRRKSSSSLAVSTVDSRRSERKLSTTASIPEVYDHFSIAESRCSQLQDKLSVFKSLRRKKKQLKKQSLTKVADPPAPEQQRTPPPKASQFSAKTQSKLQRLKLAPVPLHGYVDEATIEQHQILSQMKQSYRDRQLKDKRVSSKPDAKYSLQAHHEEYEEDVDIVKKSVHAPKESNRSHDDAELVGHRLKRFNDLRSRTSSKSKQIGSTRPSENAIDKGYHKERKSDERLGITSSQRNPSRFSARSVAGVCKPSAVGDYHSQVPEERKVVELFNKNHEGFPSKSSIAQSHQNSQKMKLDLKAAAKPILEIKPSRQRKPWTRRRHYETPTLASQMKHIEYRQPSRGDSLSRTVSKIPFVASISTSPSHNIGVNLQQILNSMKVRQTLQGIPLTIAYHMGLSQAKDDRAARPEASMATSEVNVLRLGRQLLRLNACKFMSFKKLLSLFSESDGVVSRFLNTVNKPHYFYTSMYNLSANREEFETVTSKGQYNQEAKQSLQEYAALFREYEQVDAKVKEGYTDQDLLRRKAELSKQLTAREDHIRWVIQEYKQGNSTKSATAWGNKE